MATKLGNPKQTIEIIQKHGFMFQKKFGQNFLIDTRVLEKIVAAAGVTKDDCVLEIGPGIGTLTQYLAERAGSVIAVEYNQNDRATMESNIEHFGLHNIHIIDHVDEKTMEGCPVPSLVFLVASASMEQEIECLLKLNPKIEIVVYTLDFGVAASLPKLFEKYGVRDVEVIQIAVSKLNGKNTFEQQPAPWIISGKAVGK